MLYIFLFIFKHDKTLENLIYDSENLRKYHVNDYLLINIIKYQISITQPNF